MPMFAPVFVKGKSNIRTVSSFTLNASSTTIVLTAAASPIAVGNFVFVSQADGTLCEYLGKATAVASATVTTMYRGRIARSAGALVWTPTASWQAASVISLGACSQDWSTGIETLETTGAQPLHTKVAEHRDLVEMTWSMADRADRVALKAWLLANAGDGLGSFTAAWNDVELGAVATAKVKLSEPGRVFSAQSTAYRLRSWVLGLCVVAADSYL